MSKKRSIVGAELAKESDLAPLIWVFDSRAVIEEAKLRQQTVDRLTVQDFIEELKEELDILTRRQNATYKILKKIIKKS